MFCQIYSGLYARFVFLYCSCTVAPGEEEIPIKIFKQSEEMTRNLPFSNNLHRAMNVTSIKFKIDFSDLFSFSKYVIKESIYS